MLLDTGADATMLPQNFVKELDLIQELTKVWETEDFEGKKGQSKVVNLQMVFDGKSFRGEFLLLNQDYGIIGRNILNLFKINFDRKSLKWEIS